MIVLRFLCAPFTGRTWREFGYALAGLLMAAPMFVFALLGLIGTALSLIRVGLPLLAAALFVLRGAARYFRGPALWLLGWTWPDPPPLRLSGGLLRRMTAIQKDGTAWRALLYCLVKFPLSVVTVWLLWFFIAGLVTAIYPLRWSVGEGFFTYGADSLDDTWIYAASGAAVALAFPWAVRALVGLDRLLIRGLLEPGRTHARIAQLEAGRAALQADAVAVLRRVERDLHDGTQARLVALATALSRIERRTGADVQPLISDARDNIAEALVELRDIIRAVHPPALDHGLPVALETLAARSPVPVDLDVDLVERPSDAIASAVYFTVSELVTNVARHAHATQAALILRDEGGGLRLTVQDNGRGGAHVGPEGSGLAGLTRRIAALDGSLTVDSPHGGPTTITMTLPKEC